MTLKVGDWVTVVGFVGVRRVDRVAKGYPYEEYLNHTGLVWDDRSVIAQWFNDTTGEVYRSPFAKQHYHESVAKAYDAIDFVNRTHGVKP